MFGFVIKIYSLLINVGFVHVFLKTISIPCSLSTAVAGGHSDSQIHVYEFHIKARETLIIDVVAYYKALNEYDQ